MTDVHVGAWSFDNKLTYRRGSAARRQNEMICW